jgi:hypothetical protein
VSPGSSPSGDGLVGHKEQVAVEADCVCTRVSMAMFDVDVIVITARQLQVVGESYNGFLLLQTSVSRFPNCCIGRIIG